MCRYIIFLYLNAHLCLWVSICLGEADVVPFLPVTQHTAYQYIETTSKTVHRFKTLVTNVFKRWAYVSESLITGEEALIQFIVCVLFHSTNACLNWLHSEVPQRQWKRESLMTVSDAILVKCFIRQGKFTVCLFQTVAFRRRKPSSCNLERLKT
jgi:hypothetical protein